MTLYLSRLRLSEKPSVKALDQLLNPEASGSRRDAHHRLLWTVFADDPERERDFLWREERPREFLTLSAREPVQSDLFEEIQTTEFAPKLAAGDRLSFKLRVNATRTVKSDEPAPNGKPKRKHLDLVMNKLHAIPGAPPEQKLAMGEKSARASQRMIIAQEVAEEWLQRKGEEAGFRLLEQEDREELRLRVEDYSVVALPPSPDGPFGRKARKGQPQFGIMDLEGALEVVDPALFVAQLSKGFGRAKAFGCGLMLIRRAA